MWPAMGWWWTAADERDGATGCSSLGGVTRLQLGTDVERANTAVGSRWGSEYEPLSVILPVSLLVSVSIMTTMVN